MMRTTLDKHMSEYTSISRMKILEEGVVEHVDVMIVSEQFDQEASNSYIFHIITHLYMYIFFLVRRFMSVRTK